MTPFTILTAVAVPLLRPNIDTDAIIPSREMTSVSKKGLADGLFAGWRYTAVGGRDPNPDFVLNDPVYRGAAILLAGENFGCGSSREHAAWALAEYGFRAILAPSFNPIFRGNCVRNGIVPVELPTDAITWIASTVAQAPRTRLVTVDLRHQMVTAPDGGTHSFSIEPEAREMLLHGLDAIDLTLLRQAEIQAKRQADRERRPWVYL
ncbi:3-isopropylmalate dehydratase small subunit [Nitrospirillum bahiense]|uniref:3-isopropylmalate dehydratase small subunit n=1 Tax=Nitrospirillum amazonense TaxID=28077 RepID=A0A560G788_9PROT|nr:3-isopropylmalate dehydratase small subunit [Nitrospirillum amazonense]TWB29694.1 3-isopropylmalate/(R)-2-methylmalate dehydratase small subunit [Nitrospirillum amazonense]